jgi:hypothetical protein
LGRERVYHFFDGGIDALMPRLQSLCPNTALVVRGLFADSICCNYKCLFGSVHVQVTVLPAPWGTQALALLRSLSATGAPFDSQDRSPAPKCHPGTRSDILSKIYTWIGNHNSKKLCWVHGPAGAGKSAIAQTVAERCA